MKRKIVAFLLNALFLGTYVWVEKTWSPISMVLGGGYWGTIASVGMGIVIASAGAMILSRTQTEGEET